MRFLFKKVSWSKSPHVVEWTTMFPSGHSTRTIVQNISVNGRYTDIKQYAYSLFNEDKLLFLKNVCSCGYEGCVFFLQ